jgi:drug/metabolite transporter (DMT)-like permease
MSVNIEVRKGRLAVRAALMLFGIFCASTAAIFVKASDEQPLLVAAYRLLIAALILSPWFFRELKASRGAYGWQQVAWSALPAAILAINFSSFVVGARMTQAANAGLIIGLTPVVMPVNLWVINRERINRREIFGSLFSHAGIVVLLGGNLHLSRTNAVGDFICLGSMLALAGYLTLGRKNASRISLWLYIVPLYFIAGLTCLTGALFFINPIKSYTLSNVLLFLALGVISTALGQTLINYSLRYFRGQIVSLANMLLPFFTGVMGFLFFGELPTPAFYVATVLIGIGIFAVLFSNHGAEVPPMLSKIHNRQQTSSSDQTKN